MITSEELQAARLIAAHKGSPFRRFERARLFARTFGMEVGSQQEKDFYALCDVQEVADAS